MSKVLKLAIDSIKQNLRPGIVLWSIALILVLLYYFFEPSRVFFNFFGDLKTENGKFYAIVSTSLFGGLIPFIYLLFVGEIKRNIVPELLFYLLFWAWKGWEVDMVYTYQGVWFGTEPNAVIIVKKTLVDQFIYTAFWAAPTIAVFYLWKNCDFRFKVFRKELNKEFFQLQMPAVIISNWIVWIPAVAIIYSLPMQLQIPLFNLVLCFWVLLLAILNKK